MKPYLFIDILTQFIFQIPLTIYIRNNNAFTNFFKVLGYVQIVDYSSREEFLDSNSFIYVFLKILSYFLEKNLIYIYIIEKI